MSSNPSASGGIGHKYAKCWEREENLRLQPEDWVFKMNKSAATVETDMIVENVESFETMELVEQNDVVKVVDPDFEICCRAIDLAEVVESEYEIRSKACDDCSRRWSPSMRSTARHMNVMIWSRW